MSLAYNYPSVVFLLLSTKFGPKFSFEVRIKTTLIIDGFVLIFVPICIQFISEKTALWLILGGVFVTGCATSILFGSVLGMSSLFPPQYNSAVMAGNGVAGLLSVTLRVLTKVSLPDTIAGERTSATIYFGMAAAAIFICLVSYFVLLKMDFADYHLHLHHHKKKRSNI